MSKTGRQVKIAAAIWAVSILLSRFIGIVRESVIGRVLGTGQDADIYWASFVLPDFLNYLLAGGFLSIVFIPIFGGHLARDDEEAGWRAFSVIANFLVLALSALVAALWVIAPWLVEHVIAPGFSDEATVTLARLTRIVLPAQIFVFLGGLISATLQARDRHVAPAMAPLLYTLSIVIFGVSLGPRWGPEAFAWGVLVGAFLGPFAVPFADSLRQGLSWKPTLDLTNPDFRKYLWLSLPLMIGQSIVVVDDWFIKRFGSLVATGVVSQLQYAKTLMKVPMGVFGVATGAGLYPTVSRLVAQEKTREAYDTLIRAVRAVLVLALTAGAGLMVAGTEAAEVIWGTTRFTPEDLGNVGLYTAVLCLGLWAWATATVYGRGFYAMERTWLPTALGTVVTLLAWPLYRGLAETYGGLGLACASSLALSLYVTSLAWLLRRVMAPDSEERVLGLLGRMILAVAIGVGAGLALEQVLPQGPALLIGGLSGTTACALTLVSAWALGVSEVRFIAETARRKLRL